MGLSLPGYGLAKAGHAGGKSWFTFCIKPTKLKLGKNYTTAISLSYEISITVIMNIEEVTRGSFYRLV